jgi:hypothetical protein
VRTSPLSFCPHFLNPQKRISYLLRAAFFEEAFCLAGFFADFLPAAFLTEVDLLLFFTGLALLGLRASVRFFAVGGLDDLVLFLTAFPPLFAAFLLNFGEDVPRPGALAIGANQPGLLCRTGRPAQPVKFFTNNSVVFPYCSLDFS